MNENTGYDFEILLVNDGSKDKTFEIMQELREKDKRFCYLNLSRNFGKETAMIAGLDYCNGDAVVIIDADLQDPPELIPEMIKYWEEGYDDVYAKRKSREGETFFKKFTSKLCYQVLKDNGTIWISGTMHNIYSIGMALEQEGFKIINNITWKKLNPPPNISCRFFVHSTETILWAKKGIKKAKHKFNYSLMRELNGGKQMKDVWESSLTKPSEKKCGKHPTQKPMEILEKIILASTDEGDLILDPFNGSGTTGIVANKLNRKYIGIEKEKEFLDLTIRRKESVND